MIDGWWIYILIGLLCGIVSATFGVGSGIVLIPILVVFFSFPQKEAQGTCLAVMVPMALTGAIRYKLNPELDFNLSLVLMLAIGGIFGALIGAWIAHNVSGATLRKMFAALLIVAAVKILITSPKKTTPAVDQSTPVGATTDVDDK